MIQGIGIDAVHIPRFASALERWGDRLTRRLFTEEEILSCSRKRSPERHLAARFAGKISLFKALGRPMRFKDVEIVNDSSGKPLIKAAGLNGFTANITMTHDGDFSIAQVIIERSE